MKTKLRNFLKRFKLLKALYHIYKRSIGKFLQIFRRIIKKKIEFDTPIIYQLTENYVENDAVGNIITEISDMLTEKILPNIVLYSSSSTKKTLTYKFKEVKIKESDTLIYHLSIGSECSKFFKKSKAKNKILIYHNITPSRYFDRYSNLYYLCEKGRKDLVELIHVPVLSIADSRFNERELIDLGYKNTTTIACPNRINKLKDYKTNKINKDYIQFLCVGRIVRNKCVDDVIKLFAEINKTMKNTKLVIIGTVIQDSYNKEIELLVKKLNLSDRITILNGLNDEELVNYYYNSDAYLCMSEHEGFCIPLVEAMHFRLPIFAFNSTAIGETLSGSGVLFDDKNIMNNSKIIIETLSDKDKLEKIKKREFEISKNYENKKLLDMYYKKINPYISQIKQDRLFRFYSIAAKYNNHLNNGFDTYDVFKRNTKELK